MNDFEGIEDVEDNKNYFMKNSHINKKNDLNGPNKLGLEENSQMNNRTIEIYDMDIINDGYISSHKIYKIKSYQNPEDYVKITRRYSDFEWLVSQLITKYPGIILPPLPEKNPLANLNKENRDFQESRKQGLSYFLNKMIQHKDLRHTPDFAKFLLSDDIGFSTTIEKEKKAASGIGATLTGIWENMPSPSTSMVTGLVSKIWDRSEKVKKEKSQNDMKIEEHQAYLDFLENTLVELIGYAGQLSTVENDQADCLLDLASNLSKLSDSDKNKSFAIADKLASNSDACSSIQKSHSQFLKDGLENTLKEISFHISSAKDCIKRRNALKEEIDQVAEKFSDPKKNKDAKDYQLLMANDEKKEKLVQIDEILFLELRDFEQDMMVEIHKIAKEFMESQIGYSTKMFSAWKSE